MPQADNSAAFRAAAAALNEAGDKDLRREVYADLRKIAKPLGEKVIREGSAAMPKRGGFAALVAAARLGQSNSTTGRNPGVAISFRTARGVNGKPIDLRTVDAQGDIRHPTFGHRSAWRVTHVAPGAFRRPFEAGRQEVATQVVQTMQNVANEIARKTQQAGR